MSPLVVSVAVIASLAGAPALADARISRSSARSIAREILNYRCGTVLAPCYSKARVTVHRRPNGWWFSSLAWTQGVSGGTFCTDRVWIKSARNWHDNPWCR